MAVIKVAVYEVDGVEYDVPTEYDLITAINDVGIDTVGTEATLGWNDIVADIVIRGSGPNSPSWSLFRNGIYGYSFSATAIQECWLSYHIRHDYALGTAFFPHIHFATNTTNTGTVRFGFEYTIAKGYNQGTASEFGVSTIEYLEFPITANAQYRHLIAENTLGILSAKLEPDAVILARAFRDADHPNDTFPSPIFIFNVDVHYQVDRTTTINKNPNFYA